MLPVTGDVDQATEWYHQLVGLVPSDAGVLKRMGQMFEAAGDKQQAFQYTLDVSISNFADISKVVDCKPDWSIVNKVPARESRLGTGRRGWIRNVTE